MKYRNSYFAANDHRNEVLDRLRSRFRATGKIWWLRHRWSLSLSSCARYSSRPTYDSLPRSRYMRSMVSIKAGMVMGWWRPAATKAERSAASLM